MVKDLRLKDEDKDKASFKDKDKDEDLKIGPWRSSIPRGQDFPRGQHTGSQINARVF